MGSFGKEKTYSVLHCQSECGAKDTLTKADGKEPKVKTFK